MEQETVLSLLRQAGENYLSGEAMSQRLGITRAAVWKQISRLREKGYGIEASTRLGYRLTVQPEPLEPGSGFWRSWGIIPGRNT